MSRPLFYDYDGNPIDTLTWARLFEERDKRLVALTDLGELGVVSTVWLGIDYYDYHRGEQGAPLIYESKVLGGGWLDGAEARYPNREKALLGHDSMVAMLKEISQEEEHGDG